MDELTLTLLAVAPRHQPLERGAGPADGQHEIVPGSRTRSRSDAAGNTNPTTTTRTMRSVGCSFRRRGASTRPATKAAGEASVIVASVSAGRAGVNDCDDVELVEQVLEELARWTSGNNGFSHTDSSCTSHAGPAIRATPTDPPGQARRRAGESPCGVGRQRQSVRAVAFMYRDRQKSLRLVHELIGCRGGGDQQGICLRQAYRSPLQLPGRLAGRHVAAVKSGRDSWGTSSVARRRPRSRHGQSKVAPVPVASWGASSARTRPLAEWHR